MNQFLIEFFSNLPISAEHPLFIVAVVSLLALATGLGLPRQIAAFTTGFLFDVLLGFFLALTAATAGCLLTYFLANKGLSHWFYRRYPEKCQTIHQFLSEQTFLKALIIRILPLGSNFLTNIVAGSTRIPLVPFVTGTCIGFIPQMLLFSALGSGIEMSTESKQQITIASTLCALLLIIKLFVHYRNKNASKNTGI